MSSRHFTDDDLIGLLYGVVDLDDETREHLDDCRSCFARWKAVESRRTEAAGIPPLTSYEAALQRARIISRLEHPAPSWASNWAPALAAAGLLAVGVFLYRPEPQAPTTTPIASVETDAQLFSDVYAMEQAVEPRAAAPIKAMFEQKGLEEEQ